MLYHLFFAKALGNAYCICVCYLAQITRVLQIPSAPGNARRPGAALFIFISSFCHHFFFPVVITPMAPPYTRWHASAYFNMAVILAFITIYMTLRSRSNDKNPQPACWPCWVVAEQRRRRGPLFLHIST